MGDLFAFLKRPGVDFSLNLFGSRASIGSVAAKAYGDSRPRATNDTEYGRFQNRRIEYAVLR